MFEAQELKTVWSRSVSLLHTIACKTVYYKNNQVLRLGE